MGKPLIQQRRGKGPQRYRTPKHTFTAAIQYPRANDQKGTIIDIATCPAHTSPLILVKYDNGECAVNAAPEGIYLGQEVHIGASAPIQPRNVLHLKDIPEGTLIFNIESKPGDGGKFVRASGTNAKVLAQSGKETVVLLPSKKKKTFLNQCRATIGIVAGAGRPEKPFLRAGTKKLKMKQKNKIWPVVSGAAMNAIDHPFGGKRSSRKGRPTIAPKYAPPGRKVGMLKPRRTGRRKK